MEIILPKFIEIFNIHNPKIHHTDIEIFDLDYKLASKLKNLIVSFYGRAEVEIFEDESKEKNKYYLKYTLNNESYRLTKEGEIFAIKRLSEMLKDPKSGHYEYFIDQINFQLERSYSNTKFIVQSKFTFDNRFYYIDVSDYVELYFQTHMD